MVKEGTTLEFDNCLGMLVQGELKADGKQNNHIKFLLKNTINFGNHSKVRLVDGKSGFDGRLEVRPTEEDEWGTVCNRVSETY